MSSKSLTMCSCFWYPYSTNRVSGMKPISRNANSFGPISPPEFFWVVVLAYLFRSGIKTIFSWFFKKSPEGGLPTIPFLSLSERLLLIKALSLKIEVNVFSKSEMWSFECVRKENNQPLRRDHDDESSGEPSNWY